MKQQKSASLIKIYETYSIPFPPYNEDLPFGELHPGKIIDDVIAFALSSPIIESCEVCRYLK